MVEAIAGNQVFTGSEVLYTFRIFRIMKLINIAGSWRGFRVQLMTTWLALKDMGDFLILLVAYLIISSLLSTELFAYRVLFSKKTGFPINRFDKSNVNYGDFSSPRLNFNNFTESLVTNFVVIVLDGWNLVMYDVYRTSDNKVLSHYIQFYLIYFILLVIIGNMILLNLFLAVLINNFVHNRENYKDENTKNLLTYSLQASVNRLKIYFLKIKKGGSDLLNRENRDTMRKSPTIEMEERILKDFEPPEDGSNYSKNYDYRLFPVTINVDSDLKDRLEQGDGLLTKKYTRIVKLVGKSLFFFSNENSFRLFLFKWVYHKVVRNTFLILGVVSSLMLIFSDPLSSPNKGLNSFINITKQIIGFIFLIKMVLETITMGFLFNGNESYMRHGMHMLESFINVCFLLYFALGMESLSNFGVFRLIYIIEMMDLFIKNNTTKVVLKSLIHSLPSILSLMFIELIFFYALGVINVNFFRGKFYSCDLSSIPGTLSSPSCFPRQNKNERRLRELWRRLGCPGPAL